MSQENYFDLAHQEDGNIVIRFSDHGKEELGALTFIDLPADGAELTKGQPFLDVEAEKAVTNLDSPVSGTVVASNGILADTPDAVSDSDPDKNWVLVVKPSKEN